MNPETTQASLLERLRDPNDQVSWREFDARYRHLILRYCLRRGLSMWDAEDVRQIVMVNLSRTFPRFEYDPSRGSFRGYVGRVVRGVIARYCDRSLSLVEMVGHEPATPQVPSQIDEVWEDEWMNHHLRTAMGRVRREFRSGSIAIFERLLRGESPAAIARSSGIALKSVEKVRLRVRTRLQEEVRKQVEAEDLRP